VIGVDADRLSLEFARQNEAVCAPGASAGFVLADVIRRPLRGVDAVFIDPARRDGQRQAPPPRNPAALPHLWG